MVRIYKITNLMILGCFAFLVGIVSFTEFSDYDYWWHLKKGEVIIKKGDIINPDTFSYTFSGQPDENSEWLADLLIYQSHHVGGFVGSNIFKALLLLVTFLFLLGTFRALNRKNQFWFISSILTLVLVLFAIRFRLYVRPFIFSYLFFSAFIFLVTKFSITKKNIYLYLLFLTQILWANSSSGALFGLAIIGIYILADFFQEKKINPKLLLVGLGVLISFCISPTGPMRILYFIANFLDSGSRDLIFAVGEHQPLSSQLLFGYGITYTFGFQLILLASLLEIVFFKGYKRLFFVFLFITFLLPTTIMIRLISFFSIASAGLLFLFMDRLMSYIPKVALVTKIYTNVLICILLLGLAYFSTTSEIYAFGSSVKERAFPEKALAFLDEVEIEGRMFNSYSIGGYLIWNAPDRKVFIDGRAKHVYSGEFYEQYEKMLKNPDIWEEVDKEWGFNYAVFEYDMRDGGKHFAFHLNENEDWALVYWDNHSAIYLKRNDDNKKIIGDHEYKITKPNQYNFDYLNKYKNSSKDRIEALNHIFREINLNPENQEPILAAAYFLLNFGTRNGRKVGLDYLKKCLEMEPDLGMEHSAYASILLSEGKIEEAEREVEKALSSNSHDINAYQLKLKIEELKNKTPE